MLLHVRHPFETELLNWMGCVNVIIPSWTQKRTQFCTSLGVSSVWMLADMNRSQKSRREDVDCWWKFEVLLCQIWQSVKLWSQTSTAIITWLTSSGHPDCRELYSHSVHHCQDRQNAPTGWLMFLPSDGKVPRCSDEVCVCLQIHTAGLGD